MQIFSLIRKHVFILLAILNLLLPSCRENKGFGRHEIMKMDKTHAEITANGGIVTFECKNYNLHLSSISIFEEDELVREWSVGEFEKEYPGHEDDWFTLDFPKKEDDKYYKKQLRIEVVPNKTSVKRSIEIHLDALFHSTKVVVVQKAE